MDEFERDLAENTKAIETARNELLDRLRTLTDDDLRRTRRGGWSVQEVLRHVIDAELSYAKVIAHLRSLPLQIADAGPDDVASVPAADRRARAVPRGADGVRSLGTNQYSVMSVLENVANHDHEHLGQIAKTLASAGTNS